ncbi:hypothetical protein ABG768_015001 [Culter alburnus]|uniref:Gastrin-releasing peptide n=1 Tax=Culter alburnus TaxID=194366 RepID=A0AAW1Z2C1_CULAL
MGVMCLVWRYRLVVSMILVVVLCDVYASDAQSIGKVYPRGNHWAVGHLMGKKSTDEQVRPEESEGDDKTFMTTSGLQLERFNKHLLPPLLYALMRGRTEAGSMQEQEGAEEISASKLLQRMLTNRRQWEEDHERGRQVKLIADLLKALRMQDDNES